MVYKDFRFCFIKTLEEILMSEKETGQGRLPTRSVFSGWAWWPYLPVAQTDWLLFLRRT